MKNETKKLSYIEGTGSIVINVILFILKYCVFSTPFRKPFI